VFLIVPLVGWTRVALGRHTVGEVWAGGLIGSCVTALIFYLMPLI
jgi:membrane-associated phospholipid phosphatase